MASQPAMCICSMQEVELTPGQISQRGRNWRNGAGLGGVYSQSKGAEESASHDEILIEVGLHAPLILEAKVERSA